MAERILSNRECILSKTKFPGEELTLLNEEELMEFVRNGSKEAFRIIVTRHMKPAYYAALGLLRNHNDALDLSQEAFIRAYKKRKSFDANRPFFPWFYRLLRNLCLDYIKKNKKKKEVSLDNVQALCMKNEEDIEVKRITWMAIEQLPFEHKEIIILRYFRQMSYQEIAEILEKPLGTVMSSLFYAKQKLRKHMEKYMKWD